MIEQTIRDIEGRIRDAKNLSFGQRRELQELVADLKQEVEGLMAPGEPDALASLGAVTNLEGLRSSVKRFETSHPTLTLTVNGISTYFSNLGI